MRASLRDPESLAALRPLEMVSYLRASGWTQQRWEPDRFAVWTKTERGEEFEVLLPLARVADFALRMSDVLNTLERSERRSQLEIFADLSSTTADVIRVNFQNAEAGDGTIPLEQAVSLVQKARDMMMSAACAVIEHRAYYPPRKFGQAMEFLRRVRMGQTERGSYVVTIISKVAPALANEAQGVEEPFERRVTHTLADALVHVQQAAEQSVATGSMDAFRHAVEHGVSANLCEAIVGMAGGPDANRNIDVRFSWSASRPIEGRTPREVLLASDAIPIIEEAGRILRETSPIEEFELQGFVIALDRPAGAEVGTVTVLGFVEEAPRRIRIQLRDPDYHIAVQAHDQRLPIVCIGELLREGRSFVLNQPRQLRIGQEEEA